MKKTTLTLMTLVIVAAMAGCAPRTAAPSAAQSAAPGSDAAVVATQRQLPLATKLILGTLKLEGTANEVTAEQAAELTPLWKGYLAVSKSESASRLELDGLANQIAESMTNDQMAAIEAMDLTGAALGELMRALGLEMGAQGGLTEEQRATMQAQRSSGGGGGFRGGGGPGGAPPGAPPGGFPGGRVENISPQQMQTVQAMRAANGGGGVPGNTLLVEKLIEVLAAK